MGSPVVGLADRAPNRTASCWLKPFMTSMSSPRTLSWFSVSVPARPVHSVLVLISTMFSAGCCQGSGVYGFSLLVDLGAITLPTQGQQSCPAAA